MNGSLAMTSVRRLPITLLEVLIVFFLLALVMGIAAISINKALVEQRFRTEVSMIVDELRLAQNIMTILKTDVRVVVQEAANKKGIDYHLEMDTILPPNIMSQIKRQKRQLKAVKGFFFHDELASESKQGRLEIKFLSSGAVMSQGIIRLATTDNENPPPGTLESYICLVGYPHPIVSLDTLEDAEKICSTTDTDADRRLTEDTISRIPEKVKEKELQSTDTESKPDKEASPENKQGIIPSKEKG